METVKKEKTCKYLVHQKFDDIEQSYIEAFKYYNLDEEQRYTPQDESLTSYDDIFEYCNNTGLSWDFVERETFEGQTRPYFRFQLSWGGPSDEFRIYVNYDQSIDYIEYWYMDWFDGAYITIDEDSKSYEVCSMFLDCEEKKDSSELIELEEDSEEEDE